MTRVCVVRLGPFASDPRVARQAMALAEEPGVTVDVFARGPEPASSTTAGLRVSSLGRRPPSDRPLALALQAATFAARTLRRILTATPSYDVVIVHSIPSWLTLLLWPVKLRRRRPRLLLDHHEPEAEMLAEAGLPRRLARTYLHLESAAIRRADGVVDVSEPMRTRSARLGARRQMVVDNAPALFVAVPESASARPAFDLAVFGSLHPRYDVPTLRQALDGLEQPVAILQSGRGPARMDRNPTGGPWVDFDYLEPPELQAGLLRSGFGFVGLAPSPFTNLISPNRLFELSALSIPAIAARTPVIEGLVGPFAVYYEGGSAASLHRALERALLMAPDERRAMGQGASRRLRDRQWSNQRRSYVRYCLDRHAELRLRSGVRVPRALKHPSPEADVRVEPSPRAPRPADRAERSGAP